MKLSYKEIEIRMQQGAAICRIQVPAWEVPILESMHDEITPIRDICQDREAPSVSVEMQRLTKAYGAERKEGGFTGVPYVEAVYGTLGIGLANLKQAMQASVLPASTPVTPHDLPPNLRQDVLQAISESDDTIADLIGETDDDQIEA